MKCVQSDNCMYVSQMTHVCHAYCVVLNDTRLRIQARQFLEFRNENSLNLIRPNNRTIPNGCKEIVLVPRHVCIHIHISVISIFQMCPAYVGFAQRSNISQYLHSVTRVVLFYRSIILYYDSRLLALLQYLHLAQPYPYTKQQGCGVV